MHKLLDKLLKTCIQLTVTGSSKLSIIDDDRYSNVHIESCLLYRDFYSDRFNSYHNDIFHISIYQPFLINTLLLKEVNISY